MTPTAPIDQTHADALDARDRIRRDVAILRRRVAQWEPRACPKEWKS
jgi:hypothetical protein